MAGLSYGKKGTTRKSSSNTGSASGGGLSIGPKRSAPKRSSNKSRYVLKATPVKTSTPYTFSYKSKTKGRNH